MRKLVTISALGLTLAAAGIASVQAQQTPSAPDDNLYRQAHWHGGGDGEGKGGRHHGRHERDEDRGGRGMMQRMERFDTNGDGALTQGEIDGFNQGQVTKYDTDKNGSLSLSEYQALWGDQMRERTVRAFQRNDRDGDGQVTPQELNERFAGMVERFDRNGDGQLNRDDRRGHRRGPPPEMPAPAQPGTPPAPQAAPAPAPQQ